MIFSLTFPYYGSSKKVRNRDASLASGAKLLKVKQEVGAKMRKGKRQPREAIATRVSKRKKKSDSSGSSPHSPLLKNQGVVNLMVQALGQRSLACLFSSSDDDWRKKYFTLKLILDGSLDRNLRVTWTNPSDPRSSLPSSRALYEVAASPLYTGSLHHFSNKCSQIPGYLAPLSKIPFLLRTLRLYRSQAGASARELKSLSQAARNQGGSFLISMKEVLGDGGSKPVVETTPTEVVAQDAAPLLRSGGTVGWSFTHSRLGDPGRLLGPSCDNEALKAWDVPFQLEDLTNEMSISILLVWLAGAVKGLQVENARVLPQCCRSGELGSKAMLSKERSRVKSFDISGRTRKLKSSWLSREGKKEVARSLRQDPGYAEQQDQSVEEVQPIGGLITKRQLRVEKAQVSTSRSASFLFPDLGEFRYFEINMFNPSFWEYGSNLGLMAPDLAPVEAAIGGDGNVVDEGVLRCW
ncbi:hypothetical protein Bca52824_048614 [Brassica carinata]|uniref:Uncharacterized protein n=1 Tax=Brassica carinata TaxID=52824 RepID=A0A8X7RIR7_BRACI|nr:hypothetical protein Bca52824_048614 [Brassica carinata]